MKISKCEQEVREKCKNKNVRLFILLFYFLKEVEDFKVKAVENLLSKFSFLHLLQCFNLSQVSNLQFLDSDFTKTMQTPSGGF